MNTIKNRYPGVQPFQDDPVSRCVFFGRERESKALTDQIIANRLVVLYAKSGLGKTSLLQAGVAQSLREDGFLPLVARVNSSRESALWTVLDTIAAYAKRLELEYCPGTDLSLWHFFKTAEFWRGDILLTPVLILDQFEELFTLHGDEARDHFLAELGWLVRGIRPSVTGSDQQSSEPELTESSPDIRVVISLREDYLGHLEEATDHLPQILDHRFRLLPLSTEAATTAIEGPARVSSKELATHPFTFRPEAVQGILEYLLRRTSARIKTSAKFVEPFHLQLICQRAETLVAQRQQKGNTKVEIDLSDLGGEKGLKITLRSFYLGVVQSLRPKQNQRQARRLCEQYLISPEGRRLSLDEDEIWRLLRLDRGTLQYLVKRRLLRADQRADSWYYELSHDSLIEPILATRRVRGLLFGTLSLLGSLIVSASALGIFLSFLGGAGLLLFAEEGAIAELTKAAGGDGIVIALVISLFLSALLGWAGLNAMRRSVEALNRYVPPPS